MKTDGFVKLLRKVIREEVRNVVRAELKPILNEVKIKKNDINLQELFDACSQFSPKTLIGSSGTFDTLSDIYSLKANVEREKDATEYPLTIDAFMEIYHEMIIKGREERLAIPGMIPLRVDMIVVACELVNYIIHKLELTNIRVSAYALKEGVLLNTLYTLKKEETL